MSATRKLAGLKLTVCALLFFAVSFAATAQGTVTVNGTVKDASGARTLFKGSEHARRA